MIKILRQVLLLSCLAVVEHEAEAVALISRTLLGAVGDVAPVGRIKRRSIARGIVGGDVLRLDRRGACRSVNRYDPEIVVGGGCRILVVIRRVANLLPIGRKGVVILTAQREDRRIVIAGSQIAR